MFATRSGRSEFSSSLLKRCCLYCCRWWCDEGIDDTDTAMSLWMKMTATTTASLKIATNISVADYETTKKRPGDWMAAMHHLLHRVMTASECLLLRRRRRRSTERAKPAMPMKSEKCEIRQTNSILISMDCLSVAASILISTHC